MIVLLLQDIHSGTHMIIGLGDNIGTPLLALDWNNGVPPLVIMRSSGYSLGYNAPPPPG